MAAISTEAMLLTAVREYVAAHGRIAHRLRIDTTDGEKIVLLMPVVGAPAVASGDAANDSTIRDEILELLADAAAPLKSSAIARQLNRKFSGSFRSAIKGLRDSGDIVADANGRYSVAE